MKIPLMLIQIMQTVTVLKIGIKRHQREKPQRKLHKKKKMHKPLQMQEQQKKMPLSKKPLKKNLPNKKH
jgi:hypothetical protein